jgi:uncharacterized protein (DUF2141 family)
VIKLALFSAAALAAFGAAVPVSAQTPVGPDAAACRPGANVPAALVKLDHFKSRRGIVRVQVHGDDASTFLERGKHLKRVEVPVPASGPLHVCVRLPAPGRYAIAVQHRTSTGGWNPMNGNDGGGFSRNPRLSPANPRPDYGQVVFNVGNSAVPLDVQLYYRYGLTIRTAR